MWFCSDIFKATSFGCVVSLWPHGGTDERASEHYEEPSLWSPFPQIWCHRQKTGRGENDTESKQEQEFSVYNLWRTKTQQEWRYTKRKRETLKLEEERERKQTELRKCGFLLSGSALRGGGGGGATWDWPGPGGWVVLVNTEFVQKKLNWEKFGVCLNIYMQNYSRGLWVWRDSPINTGRFLCHHAFK